MCAVIKHAIFMLLPPIIACESTQCALLEGFLPSLVILLTFFGKKKTKEALAVYNDVQQSRELVFPLKPEELKANN